MADEVWRIYVELRDRRLLTTYLRHMGWSGRELARRAGLGHAIVAHLLKGTRSTCSANTAHAIEDALGCPRGLLFRDIVSNVSSSNGREVEVA